MKTILVLLISKYFSPLISIILGVDMGNCVSISFQCDHAFNSISSMWRCMARRARYVYKVEEDLELLRTALEDLTDAKNDTKKRIEVAELQQLKRLDKVERWISRVEDVETQVNELMIQEVIKKPCPWNGKFNYKLGKTVNEKLAEVKDLLSKGAFDAVAFRSAASADEVPVDPTIGLEPLFNKVCQNLCDENIGIIGLYGMGGVGKTTLLKHINNCFFKSPEHYVVIWVVMSRDFKFEKIQDDIGERLGLSLDGDTWEKKSHHQKAVEIFRVLNKKKFLLLMDDLWERVDLTQVGIPLPNRQNGSKLVFSTRSKDVCSRMHAQKKIEVECLAWDMAWKLFQEKVGEEPLSIHPDIPVFAETVAKECGGLPLALITIGRAMACKTTPEEWKYAIHMLKTSASEFSSMGDEVFPLLKFSYDSLSSDRVRSCFLYCALFPEDASIDINDLIDYWVGEELLDKYGDTYGAQDQGYSIIGTLLSACLLEKSEDTTLKMHDVIRDMALWIAGACSEAGHGFLVQTGLQLTEQPDVEKWNGVKRISFNNNFIESLSETPTCPNLLTLFLRNYSLFGFNDSFFELMPRLKVLDLSQNRSLTSLSPGISRLVSLQYLNLSQTGIQDIPAELRSLVGLKYFNLFEATKLDIIPQRLISSFSMLQVLNMFNCGNSEIVVEECVQCGGNESLIEELQTLKHLYSLRLSIKSVSALNLFLASQKLQKCARGILLHHLRVLCVLDMSSFATVQHLDELCITVCENLEELVMDWALNRSESQASDHIQCSIMGESFLSLQHFRIQHCHKLRDLSWLIFAPNLKTLYIHACAALEEIVCLSKLDASKVVQHLEPFSKLKNIILLGLPSLKSIYLKPLTFRYLEEVNVFGCRELKKLPIKYGITEGCKMVICGKESWWHNIEWEDESTLNAFHHCFQAK